MNLNESIGNVSTQLATSNTRVNTTLNSLLLSTATDLANLDSRISVVTTHASLTSASLTNLSSRVNASHESINALWADSARLNMN
jgi:hypothetical protein